VQGEDCEKIVYKGVAGAMSGYENFVDVVDSLHELGRRYLVFESQEKSATMQMRM